MDKFFRQKALAAILFMACLFAMSFLSIRTSWSHLRQFAVAAAEKGFPQSAANELEAVINDNVYQKQWFIDAFGFLQRLMLKNVQPDFEIVRDARGMLHKTRFAEEPDNTLMLTGNLKKLQSGVGTGVPFLYVSPPDKYIRGVTAFPQGIPYNDANETADSFLRMLSLYDIDTVDLRERLHGNGIPLEKLFYKTDLRWTTQAGFWAFTELAGVLRERYGIGLGSDGFFTDANNYNHIAYPASHLGGLGEKTGKYYAGADDFTVIYPKFDTDYTVSAGYGYLGERTTDGRFEDALLSAEPFTRASNAGYVLTDKYSSYALVGAGAARIKNNMNPDGAKIAFLSDSMMIPTASFLSAVCSDIYIIDPAHFSGDIYEILSAPELELIIVSFSPENLKQAYFAF